MGDPLFGLITFQKKEKKTRTHSSVSFPTNYDVRGAEMKFLEQSTPTQTGAPREQLVHNYPFIGLLNE